MKVLGYLDKSRLGNDCYINESYSLCECFGIYFILKVYKVSGWNDAESVYTVGHSSDNICAIMKKWEELGGTPIETVD